MGTLSTHTHTAACVRETVHVRAVKGTKGYSGYLVPELTRGQARMRRLALRNLRADVLSHPRWRAERWVGLKMGTLSTHNGCSEYSRSHGGVRSGVRRTARRHGRVGPDMQHAPAHALAACLGPTG